ncbi:MAG: hypothetical protein ABI252_03495 [Candidatus Kapaibacterium sp.]|jgi:hypothetical protein
MQNYFLERAMNIDSKTRNIIVAVILVLIFLWGWSVGRRSTNSPSGSTYHETTITNTTRTRPDSMKLEVRIPLKPLHILKRATSRDSVLVRLDTLLLADTNGSYMSPATHSPHDPDTIHATYDLFMRALALSIGFAERRDSVVIKYVAHDSVITKRDSIVVTNWKVHPWYEEALQILGALAAGFLFGALRR